MQPVLPSPGTAILRLFSFSWGFILGGAAWYLWRSCPDRLYWLWPLGLAILCGGGLLAPARMLHPYRLVEKILRPVGEFMSLLLLGLVYFGLFTPYALLLRIVGWDPLQLQRKHWRRSAWSERPDQEATRNYYWQY